MITYLVILSKVHYEENTFPQARNYRWEISLFISRSHSLTFPFLPTLRYQNKILLGTSLVVQWLGLSALTAGGLGSILTGELRSCKLHRAAPQINC